MAKNRIIRKAKEELDYLTGDEEIRRLAELRDKAIRDEKTNLIGAKIEIAKKLLQKGIKIDTIREVTGLSEKEINKFSKNILKNKT